MSKTGYARMKNHFDQLITSKYPASSGLEPIRGTYETMFGKKIHMQDVYEGKLMIETNPIRSIISMVGPELEGENDLPMTGIIGCSESGIFHVNHFSEDIYKGISSCYGAKEYINYIFGIMREIVSFDRMFVAENVARNNPYCALLYAYPLYFTYHHVKDCTPELFDEQGFIDLFEKYYEFENIPEILKSLANNKYSEDAEVIYRTMTCGNTQFIV